MLNIMEVHETNQMIEQEKLDVRTITMGISLLDCATDSVEQTCDNIYRKITTYAKDLVSTGQAIESDYGIPIVNKRITVTPISLVGASCCKTSEDFVQIAHALDKAAKEVGVDLIGGYSALVSKAMTPAEELLIKSLPQALSETDIVCSSVTLAPRNRYRHECGGVARPYHQRHRRAHRRQRFLRLREIRGLLQCSGRQSIHGGRFPRRY